MPDNPVKYGDKQELICKSMQDFQIQPVWQLKKTESKVFVINNGREAAVTSEPYTSKLSLKNITEVWAGMFVFSHCIDTYSHLTDSYSACQLSYGECVMYSQIQVHIHTYGEFRVSSYTPIFCRAIFCLVDFKIVYCLHS